MTYPALKNKAQKVFNAFIRERDKDLWCISCGSFNTAHASHFYAAGKYTGLCFDVDNVHLSCVKCNTFESGNLHEYRKRLLIKIGEKRLKELDLKSDLFRFKKWDRQELEFIIITYKK